MDENRVFKLIWRVNAVAIFLVLIFIVTFGGYNLITELLPNDRPAVITNIADDPAGEEKWSLGFPEEIDGTRFFYIPLVSEKKNISAPEPAFAKKTLHSYGSGYFSPSRNLLFVDKQTMDMNWLFRGNGQLITDIDLLSVQEKYAKDRKIDAILYKIIKKDTNADGQLTSDDITDIAVSNSDGKQYKEIFQTVERVFGTMNLDGKELLILYQSKGKGYASTISLKDMSVRGTNEIPRVEMP